MFDHQKECKRGGFLDFLVSYFLEFKDFIKSKKGTRWEICFHNISGIIMMFFVWKTFEFFVAGLYVVFDENIEKVFYTLGLILLFSVLKWFWNIANGAFDDANYLYQFRKTGDDFEKRYKKEVDLDEIVLYMDSRQWQDFTKEEKSILLSHRKNVL